jgi:hypothetical protein
MLAPAPPAPPALVSCLSYHLLPQPLRVEWCDATARFCLHGGGKQELPELELEELQRIRTEMQLVGGSNLDIRTLPAHKRGDLASEVDSLIESKLAEQVWHEPTSPPRGETWPWMVLAAAFMDVSEREIFEVRSIGAYVLEKEGVPKEKYEEVHSKVFSWLEVWPGRFETSYRLSERAKRTLDWGGWWGLVRGRY